METARASDPHPSLDEPGGRQPVDEPHSARVGDAEQPPEGVDRAAGREAVECHQRGGRRGTVAGHALDGVADAVRHGQLRRAPNACAVV